MLKGKKIGDRTYKNHLDGYDQMAAITGKGPSARHEIFYLGESTVGAVRIDDYKFRFIDQPEGWLGEKTHPDVPYITNLRLDPFERTGWPNNGTKEGAQQYFDWFKYQFWRFVFVQQLMGKELQTFLDYPADAARRELQSRRRQSGDAEEDGRGGSGVEGSKQLANGVIGRRLQKGCPLSPALQKLGGGGGKASRRSMRLRRERIRPSRLLLRPRFTSTLGPAPRETSPKLLPMFPAKGMFSIMKARHQLWMKKFPNAGEARGFPLMGIEKTRPETAAAGRPRVDVSELPFRSLRVHEVAAGME